MTRDYFCTGCNYAGAVGTFPGEPQADIELKINDDHAENSPVCPRRDIAIFDSDSTEARMEVI